MDPLSLLAGATIAAVALLVGHLSGRRTERRRQDRPQEPVCGCTHHKALHDPESGECHHEARGLLAPPDRYGRVAQIKDYRCPCRQYVGPEPIQSVWVPPAAVESGDR